MPSTGDGRGKTGREIKEEATREEKNAPTSGKKRDRGERKGETEKDEAIG